MNIKHTQTIALSAILPNPYRDFDLHPINQGLIDILKASYDPEHGGRDFGTIAVRPITGGKYEQVFGHHRIEAMRQLGIKEARFLVEQIDDDQMVREMVAENAGQKGGAFASQVDSVAAIVRRLAYWLLICDNAEQFAEVSATADTSQGRSAFTQAKSNLLSGGGIGQPLISQYAPTITRGAVDGALAYLKTTGLIESLIAKVQQQVEELQEAATRAEKARQAAAEKARIEAEEQQRKAVEAAKAAAAAAAKANAARKAQAEADAKVAADRAAKLEVERKTRAAEEVAARAKAQEVAEKAREQRIAAEAARAAAAEKAELDAVLHPDAIRIFKGERHQRAALPIIKKNPKCFPIEGQPVLFKEMYKTIAAAKGGEDKATFEDVAQYLHGVVGQYNAEYQKALDAMQKQREAQSKTVKARALLDELRAAMGRFDTAMEAVGEAIKDPEMRDIILHDLDFKVGDAVHGMEVTVKKFYAMGIRPRYVEHTRTEKAIPEYIEAKMVK
jgi:chemotaxis protein histidine kinase CheA